MTRKCPNCGSTSFEEVKLYDFCNIEDGCSIKTKATFYKCTECGRVEIYMPTSMPKKDNKIEEDQY